MKFLKYTTVRTTLDYNIIHNLKTEQIVGLRNQLSDIRKLRKLDLEDSIKFQWKDFQHIWVNPTIENEFIASLNTMIIKRKAEKVSE